MAGPLTVAVGWLFSAQLLTVVLLTAGWVVIFFFASAAASAGYLTVSETFPMEIRAMVIAFFYAIATAVGGIIGSFFFGNLIATETRTTVFYGYLVGATVMIAAGIVHWFLGLSAGKRSLEGIAAPLSVQEARAPRGHEAAPGDVRARSYRPSRGYSALPMALGPPGPDREIAGEVEILARALAEAGPATRGELSRRVRSRYWGPGRFREALRAGLAGCQIVRAGRGRFGAADSEKERLGTGGR